MSLTSDIEADLGDADVAEGFPRHRGPVTCVAGIPGTPTAISSGYDSAVGYVDLAQRRVALLGYHRHLVNRVVVDPHGRAAASCSSDYTIGLWDLAERRLVRWLLGHSDDVEDFAFVDDATGVSASRDRRILVWDLRTGAIRQVIEGHERDVLSISFAKGRLYSSGDDMTLRQWDLETGRLLRTWGPFAEETDTCAIDAERERIVLGADDGCIRVFDGIGGRLLKELPAHASGIKKVAVSPTRGDILSAAYDQRILIWDAEDFRLKGELERHPAAWERSFNWMPDGAGVVAGTFDGTVLLWDAASGARRAEIGEMTGNACLNDVSANAAGDMAIASDDGIVRLAHMDPVRAEWTAETCPPAGRILMNAVTLNDAANRVMAGTHDHALQVFRREGRALCHERNLRLEEGPVNCIRVASAPGYRGDAFVACYSGTIVRVTPDGQVGSRIRVHGGAVKALRLHRDRPVGVSCGADGLLLTWDFGGRPLRRLHGHTAIVDDVDIDPGGTRVASTSRDFTLKVYDLESGCALSSVDLGRQSPKSILFWDRDTVVVGNYWGYLLRVDLGDEGVTRRRIADNGISALSRCGEHLAAVSYDGSVSLVAVDDLRVVQRLRAMVQKPGDGPAHSP
jgi:WD40 repeat protein